MLNSHATAEFFNELELVTSDEAANSDLDLLLEAEKRCLLDPVSAALLEEARGRGYGDNDVPCTALYGLIVRIMWQA